VDFGARDSSASSSSLSDHSRCRGRRGRFRYCPATFRKPDTVILWRKRFVELRLDGLWDIAPGRSRKPIYEMDKIAAIVDTTLQTKPAGMTTGVAGRWRSNRALVNPE
jgi:hypothetical protein